MSYITPDEEKELIKAIRMGNRSAQYKLIANYENWIKRLVTKMPYQFRPRNNHERRELEQEGLVSLILQVNKLQTSDKFDPSKGRFISYASMQIYRDLIKLSDRNRPFEPLGNLEVEEDPSRGKFYNYGEIYTIDEKTLDEKINLLDDQEKIVIRLRFGLDGESCTLQDITDRFGRSRQYYLNVQNRALKKLRESYENTDQLCYNH